MKVKIYSDLHLDINQIKNPKDLFDEDEEIDLYIDAGDTGNLQTTIDFYSHPFWKNKKVLFVAGNHLCYETKTPLDEAILILKDKFNHANNVIFLQDDEAKINGYSFLGCTLWTDFKIFNNKFYCMKESRRFMNDYKHIKYSQEVPLIPELTISMNNISVKFLKTKFSHNPQKKYFVITHHAPSLQSASLKYRYDLITSAFCSNHEDLISKYTNNIPLWIHGHVHNTNDYQIQNTRIISNPLGYLTFDEITGFNPDLNLDI